MLELNHIKTHLSLLIIVFFYACNSEPKIIKGTLSDTAYINELKSFNLRNQHYSDSVIAFYNSIKIAKKWKSINDSNTFLYIDVTTEPRIGISVISKKGININVDLINYKNLGDSICIYTKNYYDSSSVFILKHSKKDIGLWFIQEPQTHKYRKLGTFKEIEENN